MQTKHGLQGSSLLGLLQTEGGVIQEDTVTCLTGMSGADLVYFYQERSLHI